MNFEFKELLRRDLPAPNVSPWSGYPEFSFVGGNNDATSIPARKLGALAPPILEREGETLALLRIFFKIDRASI
jgi:hypothetical protein